MKTFNLVKSKPTKADEAANLKRAKALVDAGASITFACNASRVSKFKYGKAFGVGTSQHIATGRPVTSASKVAEAEALIRDGECVTDACLAVGISQGTFRRHAVEKVSLSQAALKTALDRLFEHDGVSKSTIDTLAKDLFAAVKNPRSAVRTRGSFSAEVAYKRLCQSLAKGGAA